MFHRTEGLQSGIVLSSACPSGIISDTCFNHKRKETLAGWRKCQESRIRFVVEFFPGLKSLLLRHVLAALCVCSVLTGSLNIGNTAAS